MLRLTQIKLPLDYNEASLKAAIIDRLGIAPDELLNVTIFRRGYDARKRSNIFFIFTLDVDLDAPGAVLQCGKTGLAHDTFEHHAPCHFGF